MPLNPTWTKSWRQISSRRQFLRNHLQAATVTRVSLETHLSIRKRVAEGRRNVRSRSKVPSLRFKFCHFLALRPWTLNSLGLIFITCKTKLVSHNDSHPGVITPSGHMWHHSETLVLSRWVSSGRGWAVIKHSKRHRTVPPQRMNQPKWPEWPCLAYRVVGKNKQRAQYLAYVAT